MRPCQVYFNMFIYKITNTKNNKVYIGQVYNKSINDRFERHKHDALHNSNLYIHRAIRKHGISNFIVEQIDEAKSLKELNEKEKHWIKYYNSTNSKFGYNLTDGGDGGNTYKCKTEEELSEIKRKISISNSGANNGMARSIKAYNYTTKQEIIFNTLNEAMKFFNVKNKGVFNCNAKTLYRGEWEFANIKDEFKLNLQKHDPSTKRGVKVKLLNLETKEEQIFNSISKLYEYLNVKKLSIIQLNQMFHNTYKIVKV